MYARFLLKTCLLQVQNESTWSLSNIIFSITEDLIVTRTVNDTHDTSGIHSYTVSNS